ncbi:DUF3800 domain-containing protein [Hymenobacter guriensis]|uniref:DUF3800 domain-containing protein n=1 Tax=Hymenobacter guriensis TaxID=2793065 RepID=A0ABS0L8H0_9BACT|nr:DUF3800 domain-containing protein [Hymenobacter guriensis]MBG8556384.1 DUF3800 domain-containing protein [Hymenobacter guriensis]
MYLMYVDESGDPGRFIGTNTPHFILSGLLVSETDWAAGLARMLAFREEVKQTTGLPKKVEFHSSELVRPHKLAAYKQLHKSARVRLLKEFVAQLPGFFPNGRIISVCLDKQAWPADTDFQALAWRRLLRGFDDFLVPQQQHGLVVADDTSEGALRVLFRAMRREAQPVRAILEDVVCRQSIHSYFVQAADAIAYCLYQQEYPRGSTRKFNLHQLFGTLDGMLLKNAAPTDPQGIIRA